MSADTLVASGAGVATITASVNWTDSLGGSATLRFRQNGTDIARLASGATGVKTVTASNITVTNGDAFSLYVTFGATGNYQTVDAATTYIDINPV